MKKAILFFLVLLLILNAFLGCRKNIYPPVNEFSPEELERLIYSDFFSSPFEYVQEGEKLTDVELKTIISEVSTDKYEEYPNLHNVPRTATLYKNGEVCFIEATDPRLIGLINLYSRSVYHNQFSYSQGLLTMEYIEEFENEDFRLELTYLPYSSVDDAMNTNAIYDTIIITNKCVVLLAHDMPGYEGDEDYPFRALSHCPLYDYYNWLDLFEF